MVSTRTLFRLSGLALLIAFPLQVVGFFLHPPSEDVADVLRPMYGPAHMTLFVSWFFALLGLPALYARQADRAGRFGLVSFVLLMLATAYHLYLLLYEAFAAPVLGREAPDLIGNGPMAHGVAALAMIATPLVLAFPLFGITTLRTRVLPRWAVWLQIASVPVFILGMFVPVTAFGGPLAVVEPIRLMYYLLFLGYAGGGYALWEQEVRLKEPVADATLSQPVEQAAYDGVPSDRPTGRMTLQ